MDSYIIASNIGLHGLSEVPLTGLRFMGNKSARQGDCLV